MFATIFNQILIEPFKGSELRRAENLGKTELPVIQSRYHVQQNRFLTCATSYCSRRYDLAVSTLNRVASVARVENKPCLYASGWTH